MDIQIIQVPYDSGHEAVRTGRGPAYLVYQGVVHRLQNDGHRVQVSRVQSDLPLPTENGTTFDILRHIARHVQSAVQQSRHPIILAGNCNSCVGTLAGLDTERLGIVWFDAHGDFNTPETTTTGFLDGMGLAMASGRCWRALLATIPGFSPVADNCIIHVGSRDLDDAEKQMFDAAGIPLIDAAPGDEETVMARLKLAIDDLKARMDRIYLHIDLDVLATKQGKPNHLAVPGGLTPQVVIEAIDLLKRHFGIASAALASYDPDFDQGNWVSNAAIDLLTAIVSD